jgi:hypothetical protein
MERSFGEMRAQIEKCFGSLQVRMLLGQLAVAGTLLAVIARAFKWI